MTATLPLTPLLTSLQGNLAGLAAFSDEGYAQLAQEIREVLIATVATTGGHLSPSLGVVELTIALLSAFNPAEDRIIWDVGHQAYAYKLLTGRLDRFPTLRQLDGLCGFPSITESPYDHYGVGHSSTSISAGLGMALARDLNGEKHHVVSVIGDGSMTGGLAYEALNQAGAAGKKLIVVLNDNEMSIAKNVGALSFFLSRNLSAPWMRRTKREVEDLLGSIPHIGQDITSWVKKVQHSLKGFFTPGMLFEAFHFNYIGPVDGHDLKEMAKAFEVAKQVDKPALIHVMTIKGKGYAPAEANPVRFHGIGKFTPKTGESIEKNDTTPTYTDIFGRTLLQLGKDDPRIMGITAAMPEGTGLAPFADAYPDRFIDVGICEQHAVTLAASLATQGKKPVVAVYSTFLQRAYDQIVHDVCLQKLPVVFCIDRAGIVGEDGATHQGAFDITFMRHIPNITIVSPKDEAELAQCLVSAMAHDGPFAIRYPRGAGTGAPIAETPTPLPRQMEILCTGDDGLAVLALGRCVAPALEAAARLRDTHGISATVVNSRWVKPLPQGDILRLAQNHFIFLTIEEAALSGGFGSAVMEMLHDTPMESLVSVKRIGLPDHFIEHGPADLVRKRYGLDADGIFNYMETILPYLKKTA